MITDIKMFEANIARLTQSYSVLLMTGWLTIGELLKSIVDHVNNINDHIVKTGDSIEHSHNAHFHACPHKSLDFDNVFSKNRIGYFQKIYTKQGAVFGELLEREINTGTFDADSNGLILNKHFIVNPEDKDCPPIVSRLIYKNGNFSLPVFSWNDYLSTLHQDLINKE